MFSEIQCIAFDAVGTLIYPDPPVAEVYFQAGKKFGSLLTQDQVQRRFRSAFREVYSDTEFATNEEAERLRWRAIVEKVFACPDPQQASACFEELHRHFGRAESWSCFPEVAETIGQLAQNGYQLMVASNFDKRLHRLCDELSALAFLKKRVISSEVGFRKPSPHFYQALVESAGVPQESILMVGDDFENDVLGANESGIEAVHLDRFSRASDDKLDLAPRIQSLTELLDLLS